MKAPCGAYRFNSGRYFKKAANIETHVEHCAQCRAIRACEAAGGHYPDTLWRLRYTTSMHSAILRRSACRCGKGLSPWRIVYGVGLEQWIRQDQPLQSGGYYHRFGQPPADIGLMDGGLLN